MKQFAITFIPQDDPVYPKLLKEMPDPPIGLFVRGVLPQTEMAISVVGSRRATRYGQDVTRALVRELSGTPTAIVSGLAFGIDKHAHQAALEFGLPSIAVMPGGVDDPSITPVHHLALAHELVATQGCLVSEQPPGTRAQTFSFPIRNRIIAGLSGLTLVVEATERSGSLITAHAALEMNREVAAVPGPITRDQSQGTNRLIREGAHVLTRAQDLLALLSLEQASQEMQLEIQQLDAEETQLFEQIIQEPCDPQSLHTTGTRSVSELVMILELKGLIRRVGSGYLCRKT